MNLLETDVCKVCGQAWIDGSGIRGALATYGLDLDDVADWSQIGMTATLETAGSPLEFEARFVGAISAAILLGIELNRSGEAG